MSDESKCDNGHSVTSAEVDLSIDNNGTWSDAFQFGDTGDLTWNLIGCSFECDVKRNRYDANPLLSLGSGAGQILIDDPTQRVIHFDVAPAAIQTALQPGIYVYDLIMTDANSIITPLMHGQLEVTQGVTQS